MEYKYSISDVMIQFWERSKKRVCVLGYDNYVDSSERGGKVAAAVFSLDPRISKYYSRHMFVLFIVIDI